MKKLADMADAILQLAILYMFIGVIWGTWTMAINISQCGNIACGRW